MEFNKDFDGVFRFTNWTNEDFVVLWNNKEYTFPAQTRSPMIVPGEPPEGVQEIRKKFAFKLAQREFYNSKEYKRLSKMGQGLPPTYDEKQLEPMIQKALDPLPAGRAKVKELPKDEHRYRATKAIGEDDNLNEAFKDQEVQKLGKMPDKVEV